MDLFCWQAKRQSVRIWRRQEQKKLARICMHYSQAFLMVIYRVVKFGTKAEQERCLRSNSLWLYFSYHTRCQKATSDFFPSSLYSKAICENVFIFSCLTQNLCCLSNCKPQFAHKSRSSLNDASRYSKIAQIPMHEDRLWCRSININVSSSNSKYYHS